MADQAALAAARSSTTVSTVLNMTGFSFVVTNRFGGSSEE
jgi:hypothetical protein